MRARSLVLASLVALGLVGVIGRAQALRAARPYALTLLSPGGTARAASDDPSPITDAPNASARGITIAPDGALVVSPRPADRAGNRDPARVRLTDASGAAIRTRVEEISYDLHRIVPLRPLPRGTVRVSGIARVSTLRVARGTARLSAAPAIDRIVNHRTPVDPAQPAAAMNERVVVSLREPAPAEAALLVARWVDWHDAEGGLYGAWTAIQPAGARELVLICTAGPPCVSRNGHVPRPDERGELRWVDANGRLSDATTITVTTSP